MLDDRPPAINISEKELTRKERTTLAQLRSGHCRILGPYKSRISKDVSLGVCGKTPHDVKHLFNCPAHPTTMTPSDLWNRPVDAIQELNSRGGNTRMRWTRLKGEQQHTVHAYQEAPSYDPFIRHTWKHTEVADQLPHPTTSESSRQRQILLLVRCPQWCSQGSVLIRPIPISNIY